MFIPGSPAGCNHFVYFYKPYCYTETTLDTALYWKPQKNTTFHHQKVCLVSNVTAAKGKAIMRFCNKNQGREQLTISDIITGETGHHLPAIFMSSLFSSCETDTKHNFHLWQTNSETVIYDIPKLKELPKLCCSKDVCITILLIITEHCFKLSGRIYCNSIMYTYFCRRLSEKKIYIRTYKNS